MNLAPLPTGILRMRAGLDELVFYPEQRPILPDRLSAMAGSDQPLLPCRLLDEDGRVALVYDVGSRLRVSKLLRVHPQEIWPAAAALRALCLAIQGLPAAGLGPEGLSFCPDHIFWDAARRAVYLTYLPLACEQDPIQRLRDAALELARIAPGTPDARHLADYVSQPDFSAMGLRRLAERMLDPQPTGGEIEVPLYPAPSAAQEEFTTLIETAPRPEGTVTSVTGNLYELQRRQMLAAARQDGGGVRLCITAGQDSSHVNVTQLPCVIGRSPEMAQLVLEDPQLSRRHAVLEWVDGRLCARDLGSKNGMSVDGVRYPAGQAVPLPVGATLTRGQTLLRVVGRLEDEPL